MLRYFAYICLQITIWLIHAIKTEGICHSINSFKLEKKISGAGKKSNYKIFSIFCVSKELNDEKFSITSKRFMAEQNLKQINLMDITRNIWRTLQKFDKTDL